MVRWAATPVEPGTGIKAQIRNAAAELHLDYGTVKRAWYGIAGAEIYPVIYNAWLALVKRRHDQLANSPWAKSLSIPSLSSSSQAVPSCGIPRQAIAKAD